MTAPVSNILHATTDPSLLVRLKGMLTSSATADIAVGYFFISGFEQIAEELSQLKQVRILVGRTDRQVLEEVAAGLQQQAPLQAQLNADATIRRSERTEIAQQAIEHIAQGVSRLPQQDATESAVQHLRDLVATGRVEVRTYLRSPLHAKAYLCWYDNHAEPGAAVVGSSNLTLSGFEGNTELNVRVSGDAEMAALKHWFDELWRDAEDISDDLVTELERSWPIAQTPPYHVYLKALYELYGSDAGVGELSTSPLDNQLANFQLDAVRQALMMIDRHGGCYIGDVVGLGKTFVGAELLRQLQFSYRTDGKPLILCPAGLIPMWRQFNERFQLGAEIVSHSMIVPSGAPEFDEELGHFVDGERPGHGIVLQERYRDRGPVLVDEAHNFRNKNQRSGGLREYLDAGDHKVILMSATPQNLGPMDIYRQLTLFLDDREHGLPIEPVSLEAFFTNAQHWLRYQAENDQFNREYADWESAGGNGSPSIKPQEPSIPRAQIEDVLRHVFFRRRRKDILDLYGDGAEINGKRVSFPEAKLTNVSYRLDRVYSKVGAFAEIQESLQRHEAWRYRASEKLRPHAMDTPKYDGLVRSRDRVAGLMKVLLLKRLESSVAAFRSTLESLIRSNRHFKEALEVGYVPVGQVATRLLSGQSFDAEEALEILTQEDGQGNGSGAHPAKDFYSEQWCVDLDADFAVLDGLLAKVERITPADDDKLQAVKAFLDQPEIRDSKVLVFSEAETTITYLHEQLNPGGRDTSIAQLTGGNRDAAQEIVARFSPRANLGDDVPRPANEIRILLATDVVSEGQNLQDCAHVLNYDLHWNPVRLIQRFGRVDRIGTEHEIIHLHNTWPDLDVDSDLSLTERLGNRIQLFHDLIGLDDRLLSEAERINAAEMYRLYDQKQLPESDDSLDDVAAHQRAVTTLLRIEQDDPDLWAMITGLPDGLRTALNVDLRVASEPVIDPSVTRQPALWAPKLPGSLQPGPFEPPVPGETLVLLAAGEIHGYFAVAQNLEPRPISPAQFVAAAACQPDTPAASLLPETNERVMSAFERFRAEYGQRLGRSRRLRDTRARRFVAKQLNILRIERQEDSAELARLDELRRIFSRSLPPRAEAALGEMYRLQPTGSALLVRLKALREQYRLSVTEDEEREPPSPQIVRIVCSDGLRG